MFICDPSKLYEFFWRATQLEDRKGDFNMAAEETNIAETVIKEKLETLPDINNEIHVWEKNQFHQSLEIKKESV